MQQSWIFSFIVGGEDDIDGLVFAKDRLEVAEKVLLQELRADLHGKGKFAIGMQGLDDGI